MGMKVSKANVVVVGLDNAGKSTILSRLKPRGGESFDAAPTVGFEVEVFKKGGLQFTCFDMSGQSKYRSLWEQYYRDVQGIIFVIDSSDKLRLVVAKDELKELLGHEDVKASHCPILFYANKKDVPGALPAVEIMRMMELERISDRTWHIAESNALTGDGVDGGACWLADNIKRTRGK